MIDTYRFHDEPNSTFKLLKNLSTHNYTDKSDVVNNFLNFHIFILARDIFFLVSEDSGLFRKLIEAGITFARFLTPWLTS
jgi:Mg2+/citrate symporter